jgi:hypothetical protein
MLHVVCENGGDWILTERKMMKQRVTPAGTAAEGLAEPLFGGRTGLTFRMDHFAKHYNANFSLTLAVINYHIFNSLRKISGCEILA